MKYKIAETSTFQKQIGKVQYRNIHKKITDYVYPQLRENPFFGANIKRLKGRYANYYRFRVGKYRLFYRISQETIMVYIMSIEHRKDAYK